MLYKNLSKIVFICFLLSTIQISEKTSYAYYAKQFEVGLVENFNVFYTNNMNNQNGLFTFNDLELGISKYLQSEFEFSFMYGNARGS